MQQYQKILCLQMNFAVVYSRTIKSLHRHLLRKISRFTRVTLLLSYCKPTQERVISPPQIDWTLYFSIKSVFAQ